MTLFNPLPTCPTAHNCDRQSLRTDIPAAEMFDYCKKVLRSAQPHKVTMDEESRRIDAVFRITLFGFKDDCTLLVYPLRNGSVVHMRSASRVGQYDFGVNRRRLNRLRSRLNRMAMGGKQ